MVVVVVVKIIQASLKYIFDANYFGLLNNNNFYVLAPFCLCVCPSISWSISLLLPVGPFVNLNVYFSIYLSFSLTLCLSSGLSYYKCEPITLISFLTLNVNLATVFLIFYNQTLLQPIQNQTVLSLGVES